MKNINCILLVVAMAAGACATKNSSDPPVKPGSYVLLGEVQGFPDSTWLFLENLLDPGMRILDSALVVSGKFQFTGSIPDSLSAAQYLLRTKNLSDYKFLWLENGQIDLRTDKGKFREARIIGSRTQSEEDRLARMIAPLQKSIDSVYALIGRPGIAEQRKEQLNELLPELERRKVEQTMDFIRQHPNSLVSAHILNAYSTTWGKEKSRALFNSLSGNIKQTSYGKNISRYIALAKEIKIGDQFEDFAQANYTNEMVRLSNFKGKIVLLEFWASNCGPCRQENPSLVKTYKKYKDKGFEILGVSLDEKKEHWLAAIEKDGLIWENVSELNGMQNTAALIYGISAIPDNFLIDRDGRIIARNLRGEQLNEKLRELLR